jgi:hypothetical protein
MNILVRDLRLVHPNANHAQVYRDLSPIPGESIFP